MFLLYTGSERTGDVLFRDVNYMSGVGSGRFFIADLKGHLDAGTADGDLEARSAIARLYKIVYDIVLLLYPIVSFHLLVIVLLC